MNSATFFNHVKNRDLAKVKKALEKDFDVNEEVNEDGLSALHVACEAGDHPEMVALLLSYGADVNLEDEEGYTPLHYASMNGHDDAVQTLIEAGANLEMGDGFDRTPLTVAVLEWRFDVIRKLILAGAVVDKDAIEEHFQEVDAIDQRDEDEHEELEAFINHALAEYEKSALTRHLSDELASKEDAPSSTRAI